MFGVIQPHPHLKYNILDTAKKRETDINKETALIDKENNGNK
jgi:hypothetical protein